MYLKKKKISLQKKRFFVFSILLKKTKLSAWKFSEGLNSCNLKLVLLSKRTTLTWPSFQTNNWNIYFVGGQKLTNIYLNFLREQKLQREEEMSKSMEQTNDGRRVEWSNLRPTWWCMLGLLSLISSYNNFT